MRRDGRRLRLISSKVYHQRQGGGMGNNFFSININIQFIVLFTPYENNSFVTKIGNKPKR